MMNALNKIDTEVNRIPVQNKYQQKIKNKHKLSLARSTTNSSFESDQSEPSFESNFQPINSFSLEEIQLYNVEYFLKEQAGRVYAESSVEDFFEFYDKIEEAFGFQKFVLEKFVSSENLTYQNLIEFFDLIKNQSENINKYKTKIKPQRLSIEVLNILIDINYQHDLIFKLLTSKALDILDFQFFQTQEWEKFINNLIKYFVTEIDLIFHLLTQIETSELLQHSLMDGIKNNNYNLYQENFYNYFQDHSIKKNQLFELFCFFEYFQLAFNKIKCTSELQNYEFFYVLLSQIIEKKKLDLNMIKSIDKMISCKNFYNLEMYIQLIKAYLILEEETRANEIKQILIQDKYIEEKEQIYQQFIIFYCKKNDYEKIEEIIKEFKNSNQQISSNWIQSFFNSLLSTQNYDLIIQKVRQYKDEYLINTTTLSGICNLIKTNDIDVQKFKEFFLLSKDIFIQHHLQNITLLNYYLSISLHNNCLDIFDEILEMSKGFEKNIIKNNLIIKRLLNEEKYEECYKFIEKMELDQDWVNCSIGRLLNYFTNKGDVQKMEMIYHKMVKFNAQLCSIDYTNFIYTYLIANRHEDGLKFFEQIKSNREYAGMRITYNCALNLYADLNRIDDAIYLFDEIESNFKADHISYNTIIKALSNNKKIHIAYKYVCKLLDNLDQVEEIGPNFFNYFLESCSDKKNYSLGIKTYKKILQKNLKVNMITMGTMVKIYGFAQKINKAFDLLVFMKQQDIQPNLIYFTNLVHISFYSKNFKAAERAFNLCTENNIPKDTIFYSKLIDGMLFMKKKKRVLFYMQKANEEKCGLRKQTIEKLSKQFREGEGSKLLEKIKLNSMTQCNKEKGFKRNNNNRVKKYRNMALQKKMFNDNKKINNQQPRRNGFKLSKVEGLMDNQTKNLVAQFRKRKAHQYQLNCFNY